MKSIFIKIFLLLPLLYICGLIFLYSFQKFLVYTPGSTTSTPDKAGLLHFTRHSLKTPDGFKLDTWFRAPSADGNVILFFHGKKDTLHVATPVIRHLSTLADGLLVFDYRGFGISEGTPDKEGIYTDAETIFQWLKQQNIPDERIVVIGHSLGSAPAVRIAAQHPVKALVLLAPYSSMADVVSTLLPFVPVRFLLTENFEPIKDISSVTAPILIMHGTNDRLIPISLGQQLFEAARFPKQFVSLENTGHKFPFYDGLWITHLRDFLGRKTLP